MAEKASWFLSELSKQLPEDIDEQEHPQFDNVDFLVDNKEDLWSKNQIRDTYKKEDGSYDKNKFDNDYTTSMDKFSSYELFNTQIRWARILHQLQFEQNPPPVKYQEGGTVEAPAPVYYEGSQLASIMGRKGTPNALLSSVSVEQSRPYEVTDVNGKKFNLLDIYGEQELADKTIFDKQSQTWKAADSSGLSGFFKDLVSNRTIARKELADGSMVNELDDYGHFYTRPVEHGEDVRGVGMSPTSAWGSPVKSENLRNFSSDFLGASKDHAWYIGKSAMRSLNNLVWGSTSAVSELASTQAQIFGMKDTQDWVEDFQTKAEALKAPVSEKASQDPFSAEGAIPLTTDIVAQLMGARLAGGKAAKWAKGSSPIIQKYAPYAGFAPLALMGAQEIKQAATNAGATDNVQVGIYAAALPFMFGLNSKFSDYMTKGISQKTQSDLMKMAINKTIKDNGGDLFGKVAQKLITPTEAGKQIGKNLWNFAKNVPKGPYVGAGLNEAIEEGTEFGAEAVGAWLPRMMNEQGYSNWVREQDKTKAFRFLDDNYNMTENGKNLMLSAVTGFAGGVMGKAAGRYVFKDVDDPEIKELLYFKSTGQIDDLRKQAERMYQSGEGLASRKVGWNRLTGKLAAIEPGKEDQHMNANDMVYKALTDKIDFIDSLYDDKDINKSLAQLKTMNNVLNDTDVESIKMNNIQMALNQNDVVKTLYAQLNNLYDTQTKYYDIVKNRKDASGDRDVEEGLTKKIKAQKEKISNILSGHYSDEFFRRALYNTLLNNKMLSKGTMDQNMKDFGAGIASNTLKHSEYKFLQHSFRDRIDQYNAFNKSKIQEFALNRMGMDKEGNQIQDGTDKLAEDTISKGADHLFASLGIEPAGTTSPVDLINKLNSSGAYNKLLSYGLTDDGRNLFHHFQNRIKNDIRSTTDSVKNTAVLNQQKATLEQYLSDLQSQEQTPEVQHQILETTQNLASLQEQIAKPADLESQVNEVYSEVATDPENADLIFNEPKNKSIIQAYVLQKLVGTFDKNVEADKELKPVSDYKDEYFNIVGSESVSIKPSAKKKDTEQKKESASASFPTSVDLNFRDYIKEQWDKKNKVGDKEYRDDQGKLEQIISSIQKRAVQAYANATVLPRTELFRNSISPVSQAILKKDFPTLQDIVAEKNRVRDDINKGTVQSIAKKTAVKYASGNPNALFYTYNGSELILSKKEADDIIAELADLKRKAETLKQLSDNTSQTYERQEQRAEILVANTKMTALKAALSSPLKAELEAIGVDNLIDNINDLLNAAPETIDVDNLMNSILQVEQTIFDNLHTKRNSILGSIWKQLFNNRFENNARKLSDLNQALVISNLNLSGINGVDKFAPQDVDPKILELASGEVGANITTLNYLFKVLTVNPKMLMEEYGKLQKANLYVNNNSIVPSFEQYEVASTLAAFKQSNDFSFYGDQVNESPDYDLENDLKRFFYKYSTIAQGTLGSGKTSVIVPLAEALSNAVNIRSKSNANPIWQNALYSSSLKGATAKWTDQYGLVYKANEKLSIAGQEVPKDTIFQLSSSVDKKQVDYKVLKITEGTLKDIRIRKSIAFAKNKELKALFEKEIGIDNVYTNGAIESIEDLNSHLNSFLQPGARAVDFDTIYMDEATLYSAADIFSKSEKKVKTDGTLLLVDKLNQKLSKEGKDLVKIIFTGDLSQQSDPISGLINYEKVLAMKLDPISIKRRSGVTGIVNFLSKIENAYNTALLYYNTSGKKGLDRNLYGLDSSLVDFTIETDYYIKDDGAIGQAFYNNYKTVKDHLTHMKALLTSNPGLSFTYIVDNDNKRQSVLSQFPELLSESDVVLSADVQGKTFDMGFCDVEPVNLDASTKKYILDYFNRLNGAAGRFRSFSGVVSPTFANKLWVSTHKGDSKSVSSVNPLQRPDGFQDNFLARFDKFDTSYKENSPIIAPQAKHKRDTIASEKTTSPITSSDVELSSQVHDIYQQSFDNAMSDTDYTTLTKNFNSMYGQGIDQGAEDNFFVKLSASMKAQGISFNRAIFDALLSNADVSNQNLESAMAQDGMVHVKSLNSIADRATVDAMTMVFGTSIDTSEIETNSDNLLPEDDIDLTMDYNFSINLISDKGDVEIPSVISLEELQEIRDQGGDVKELLQNKMSAAIAEGVRNLMQDEIRDQFSDMMQNPVLVESGEKVFAGSVSGGAFDYENGYLVPKLRLKFIEGQHNLYAGTEYRIEDNNILSEGGEREGRFELETSKLSDVSVEIQGDRAVIQNGSNPVVISKQDC